MPEGTTQIVHPCTTPHASKAKQQAREPTMMWAIEYGPALEAMPKRTRDRKTPARVEWMGKWDGEKPLSNDDFERRQIYLKAEAEKESMEKQWLATHWGTRKNSRLYPELRKAELL